MSSGVRVKGLALWVYGSGAEDFKVLSRGLGNTRIPKGPYTLPLWN